MQVLTDEQTKRNIAANVSRLQGDLSYGELARRCSLPTDRIYPSAIQRIARGESMPGAGLLARLAEALGVSVDDLISTPKRGSGKKYEKISA